LRATLLRQGNTPAQAEARIGKLLDWYVTAVNNGLQKPTIHNGKEFRDCITWIERLMEKEIKDKPAEVSPAAAKLAAGIAATMSWPKGCKPRLAGVVEKSLASATKFFRRLPKVRKKVERLAPPKTNRRLHYAGLVDLIASTASGGVESFVQRWFTRVNHQVLNWPEWSGDLEYFAFSPTHREFDKLIRERVTEWGGTAGIQTWTKLKGEITGEKD
jgi:hypothetical protein